MGSEFDEADVMCIISHALLEDPVVAADGFTYSRASITAWVKDHNTSPHTNERLPHTTLIPNRRAQQHVQAYKERLGLKLIELVEEAPRKPGLEQRVRAYLAETEANVNARRKRDRRTPLLIAAELGLNHVVDALLENGADYTATDCDGVGVEDLLPALRDARLFEEAGQKETFVHAMDAAKLMGDVAGIVRLLTEATATDVHRHGCRSVWEMVRPTRETSYADANKEHAKALVTAGALEAVIHCMQSRPEHVGVQTEGCFALMCLVAGESAHQVRVAEAGGIAAILTAMAQHRDSTEVQIYGCLALGNVAGNNDANQRTIAEKRGIDIILTAMQQHPGSTEVQQEGCNALAVVAHSAATRPTIAEKGGIEAVFHAMTQHSHHERVQECGCGVMYCMVRLESARPAIRKGKEVMDAARNNFPNNSDIKRWLDDVYGKI
jgi:hypothetical protein